MTDNLGSIIARIRKNKAETTVVRLVEFHGHPCCDVRVFFEDAEGKFVPSKKGLAFNVDQIPDVIAGLQKAHEEVRQRFAEKRGGGHG